MSLLECLSLVTFSSESFHGCCCMWDFTCVSSFFLSANSRASPISLVLVPFQSKSCCGYEFLSREVSDIRFLRLFFLVSVLKCVSSRLFLHVSFHTGVFSSDSACVFFVFVSVPVLFYPKSCYGYDLRSRKFSYISLLKWLFLVDHVRWLLSRVIVRVSFHTWVSPVTLPVTGSISFFQGFFHFQSCCRYWQKQWYLFFPLCEVFQA